eukprot:359550-Chlamydomonas_euryale.AAC.3
MLASLGRCAGDHDRQRLWRLRATCRAFEACTTGRVVGCGSTWSAVLEACRATLPGHASLAEVLQPFRVGPTVKFYMQLSCDRRRTVAGRLCGW